jgi:hypothetical protein
MTPGQPYEKELPRSSTWLYFSRLPIGLTDEEFRDYLTDIGVDLPLENVSVRQYPQGSCAKIATTNDMVAVLVNWLINGEPLRGHRVVAERPGRRQDVELERGMGSETRF